jgi:hypothetical protein
VSKSHFEHPARRRVVLPPMWGFAIVMALVLLWTFVVAGFTASAVRHIDRMNASPSASSCWAPPLKTPGPEWSYRACG